MLLFPGPLMMMFRSAMTVFICSINLVRVCAYLWCIFPCLSWLCQLNPCQWNCIGQAKLVFRTWRDSSIWQSCASTFVQSSFFFACPFILQGEALFLRVMDAPFSPCNVAIEPIRLVLTGAMHSSSHWPLLLVQCNSAVGWSGCSYQHGDRTSFLGIVCSNQPTLLVRTNVLRATWMCYVQIGL